MPLSHSKSRADDFVRTAAFLKREFIGRNASVEFGSNKANRTIYVFDSDVIVTKCAPWITGPIGERDNNGYGAIFLGQNDDPNDPLGGETTAKKAEQVASILANYALNAHRDANQAPIFQFPSHARETNNVYRAVRRAVEATERIDSRGSQSRRSFEIARAVALLRHRASQGAKKEDVRELIDKVVDWLTYSGHADSRKAQALREWDNYYSLETEFGGIYPLLHAAAFFPNTREIANAMLVMQEGSRLSHEQRTFDRLINHWTNELYRRERHNIQADAEALSYLFLVNARLLETNWRCEFVTGDRTLARAAYAGIPASLLETNRQLGEDFSINHIRHLWAYSSDALIEPDKQQHFVDLFSGLLAHWSNQLYFPARTLEQLSKQREGPGEFISNESLERALSEWDTLTSKAIVHHSFTEFQKDEPIRLAIWNVVNGSMDGRGWDHLVNLLQEEVDRIRDRTILSMSDLGIDVIIQAEKLGKRNPPELIFESLKNTNAIFRKLSIVDGYKDIKSFEADLARIKDDCHNSTTDGDDRQESHLKFLVLGAAFASAERWLIALSHAKRAISIIERSRNARSKIPVRHDGSVAGTKSHMSGREAYFLAAVAQRILAANSRDFDEALETLERSVAALKEDWRQNTAKHITPSRFDNERLAIALGRYYSARSEDNANFRDEYVADIYAAAKVAVSLFSDWRSGGNSNSLRDITVVNLATNIIQTFVIGEFRSAHNIHETNPCPVIADTVKDSVDAIAEMTNYKSSDATEKINATRLIRTYASIGEMLISTSLPNVKGLYLQLQDLLKDLDEAAVTRYDKWRYQALLDFAKLRFRAALQ